MESMQPNQNSIKKDQSLTRSYGESKSVNKSKDYIDKDPFYKSVYVFQTRFDIPKYYNLEQPIGRGGYGIVCRATNTKTEQKVAIKKLIKTFKSAPETKRLLREIRILKELKHENIVYIKDILNPAPFKDFEEIYIVTELMDTDLDQIIEDEQQLDDDHFQFIMYQILCALKYIHSANIIHRDLKPSNILINADCEIKICDFGLARGIETDKSELVSMTEYVATRWYRPPELLLSWKEYTKAIDMWSLGCIFAELLGRRPLLCGKNYLEQLNLLIQLVGTPNEEDIENIQSEKAKQFIKNLTPQKGTEFEKLFPNANPVQIDLLKNLLVFNPKKRLTAEQALNHEWFSSIRDKDYEIDAERQFQFDFEDQDLSLNDLQRLIYNEMLQFHPEFNDKNPNTYSLPLSKDEDLWTLDVDGSLIYIDYTKANNNIFSLDKNQILKKSL